MRYTLYVKDGCGLCEQFSLDIAQQRPDIQQYIRTVDITHNSGLISKYGDKVPVLVENDEIICQYYFDTTVFEN